ncbi:MAG TPA: RNA polymerase sigma factor, partial [Planctomycetota bacterium]|nr:RNA polymerase sigma factor [Planctomycetota bacterium]
MSRLDEDRALASAVVRGESGAADALFESVFDPLWRQVLRRLGGDRQLTEEIVSQTLLAGLRGLPSYRGDALLSSWFFRIATRKIVDHLRRRAIELVTTGNGELEECLVPSGAPTALDGLITKELREIVVETLDLLPAGHRDVLRWRYFEDASIAEVAERLHATVKSAERRLARARAALASA